MISNTYTFTHVSKSLSGTYKQPLKNYCEKLFKTFKKWNRLHFLNLYSGVNHREIWRLSHMPKAALANSSLHQVCF